MLPLSIYDLNNHEALAAVHRFRHAYMHPHGLGGSIHPAERIEDDSTIQVALSYIGGRLSLISKICAAGDVVSYAKELVRKEKGWLRSLIGLIPDHDDDVMDEASVSIFKCCVGYIY